MDNYMVRSIAGEAAYNVGPGMVGPEHLQMAISRLRKFDQVVVLEGHQSFDAYMPTLGWRARYLTSINAHQTRFKAKGLFSNATMQRLLAINVYDVQLFQHF